MSELANGETVYGMKCLNQQMEKQFTEWRNSLRNEMAELANGETVYGMKWLNQQMEKQFTE